MPITSGIPTFTRAGKWIGRKLWRLPWRYIFGGPIVAATIAILIFSWQGSRNWAAYHREAIARGVVLERAVSGPVILDTENFAASNSPFAYRDPKSVAFDPLDFTGISLDFPDFSQGKRMTIEKAYGGPESVVHARRLRRAAYELPSGITRPRTADEFIAYCDDHFKVQWPAILEAETRPKTQYHLPAVTFSMAHPLSYLTLRKTAQLHCMRGMAFLELNRDEEALAEVRGIFRLTRAMRAGGEVDLMHSMMENAIAGLTLADVWEGLVDQRWSEADLVALQSEIASISPAKDWSRIVAGERTYLNAIFDRLASDLPWQRVPDSRDFFENEKQIGAWLGLCPSGAIRANQLVVNRFADQMSQWIDPSGCWKLQKKAAIDYRQLDSIYLPFAARAFPSAVRAAERVVVGEAWLHEAATAIALERYRLQKHNLPERLEALVPEFLPAVPLDPIGRKPVQYARESEESYRLWCEGEYPGDSFSDVCETTKVDGHDVIVWPGLPPEKPLPAVASR